jgi:hypothetical protein
VKAEDASAGAERNYPSGELKEIRESKETDSAPVRRNLLAKKFNQERLPEELSSQSEIF